MSYSAAVEETAAVGVAEEEEVTRTRARRILREVVEDAERVSSSEERLASARFSVG